MVNLNIEWLAKLMQKSNHTVVLTGAGISTASGIPDFRSEGGLWHGKDPLKISSPEALYEDTQNFVDFFTARIKNFESCQPNKAHNLLAKWEFGGLINTIVTQNIDGYHSYAGNNNVIEIHGHLKHLECDSCGIGYPLEEYTRDNNYWCKNPHGGEDDTPCIGRIRPPVVLFGEVYDSLDWFKAIQEIEKADLVIGIGSSFSVHPFAGLLQDAKRMGAKVAIINREATGQDASADMIIREDIVETLNAIDKMVSPPEEDCPPAV